MATLVSGARHPALDLDEGDRTDYLTVVASTAWADHEVAGEELARLRRMGEALELAADTTDGVIAATRDAATRPTAARVDELLARLATDELRYAILVDAIDIAYADEALTEGEAARIEALADRLAIGPVQRELVRRYVAGKRSGTINGGSLAAALAGLGLPLATIAIATSAGVDLPVAAAVGAVLGAAGFVVVRRSTRARERRG